jgi:type VI protein secretion system component VasF
MAGEVESTRDSRDDSLTTDLDAQVLASAAVAPDASRTHPAATEASAASATDEGAQSLRLWVWALAIVAIWAVAWLGIRRRWVS